MLVDHIATAVFALFLGVPTVLVSLVMYVLTALALYTIAKRREIRNAWLAWIPVANSWIIGSLSDQYRYLAKGQYRSKRKILLVLNILATVLGVTLAVMGVVLGMNLLFLHGGMPMRGAVRIAMILLALCLPLLGTVIAAAVVQFMALLDIYRSLDPDNSVLFLLLSIFIPITKPFFLFFSRERDGGMPPRKQPKEADACEFG